MTLPLALLFAASGQMPFATDVAVAHLNTPKTKVSFAKNTVNLFVSRQGSDNNDGSSPLQSAPGVGPLATVTKAVNLMRRLRPDSSLAAGVITVGPGEFQIPSTLNLSASDSNLTISGSGQGYTFITGEVSIHNWDHFMSPTVRRRISPNISKYLFSAPLTVDPGHMSPRGGDGGVSDGAAELSGPADFISGGKAMSMTRFPQTGYSPITGVSSDKTTLTIANSRRVASSANGWVEGFWCTEWESEWVPLLAAPDKQTLTVASPNYTPAVGGRVAVYNVLEDFSSPGQYYVDTAGSRIYYWPESTESLSSLEQSARFSTVTGALLSADGTSNLNVNNISFRGSRGNGISLANTTNCVINNAEISITQGKGVQLVNAQSCTVSYCTVHDTGTSGISDASGDSSNLISGNTLIDHNEIYTVGRIEETYRPAVDLHSCGASVTNNHIHDCPHQGVRLAGSQNTITGNDINGVLQDTNDCGAIYAGRNVLDQGNIVSGNVIRNCPLTFTDPWESSIHVGVYLDDLESGFTVSNNIIYNITTGVLIGGGRSNAVTNNIFSSVTRSVTVDERGVTWASAFYAPGGSYQQQLASLTSAQTNLYSQKFPAFSAMLTSSNVALPEFNSVSANDLANSNNPLDVPNQQVYDLVAYTGNFFTGDHAFTNPAGGNFSVTVNIPQGTQPPTGVATPTSGSV